MKWFTWGDDLLDGGYVQVPNLLITRQNQLGLSSADLNLILQAAACFRQDNTLSPSGRVLGNRMGIGERQVIRLKKRLMALGYLECTERTMAGRRITDDWDFSGLTLKLRTLMSDRGDIEDTPTADNEDTTEGDQDVTTSHTIDHTTKQTTIKEVYGEFLNVRLTDIERQKLLDKFGEAKTLDLIERLSGYKKSKGKAYRDDYATILNWARSDTGQKGSHGPGAPVATSQDVDKFHTGKYAHVVGNAMTISIIRGDSGPALNTAIRNGAVPEDILGWTPEERQQFVDNMDKETEA